jgi:hypothetical protein
MIRQPPPPTFWWRFFLCLGVVFVVLCFIHPEQLFPNRLAATIFDAICGLCAALASMSWYSLAWRRWVELGRRL